MTLLGSNYFKGLKMKKFLIATTIIWSISNPVLGDELADMYFTGKNPTLTDQERNALNIAKRWKASDSNFVAPVSGRDGAIQFVFGTERISVVCAVLQVCDIALQPGEQIVGPPHIGDSRWIVEPATSGSGPNSVQHVIVKPLDVGLETSLMIPTDRRMYHLRLRSHRTEYMPKVRFIYPDEMEAKWAMVREREAVEVRKNTIPQTNEYLGDLDFDYEVSGSASWKPVRVYNDGVKTIIQMPKTITQTEAPTLLVLRGSGNKDTVMVNYRVHGDRYVVDSVFDRAVLIAGVGRRQDRVTITRAGFQDSRTRNSARPHARR